MSRLVRAFMLGVLTAATPIAALATEDATPEVASRALSTGVDTSVVAALTVLAVLAVLLLAGLGYLYRRERKLDWEFQRPDAPHADGGHH